MSVNERMKCYTENVFTKRENHGLFFGMNFLCHFTNANTFHTDFTFESLDIANYFQLTYNQCGFLSCIYFAIFLECDRLLVCRKELFLCRKCQFTKCHV